jgi:hypothetical protein
MKSEYADAKTCVQLMTASQLRVIGINALRSVGSRFALGLEVFKSFEKGDITCQ